MTENVCWLTTLIFDPVHSDKALVSSNLPLGLGVNKNKLIVILVIQKLSTMDQTVS